MNDKEINQTELITPSILEMYIEPEILNPKDEEKLLKEGEITNIRLIENLSQEVSSHADEVYVGDITLHADELFEVEVILPDGKKLLAVWKPDSGVSKGTQALAEPDKKPVPTPEGSSPNSHKEVAAWIVAQYLGLEHITMPAVLRTINGEEGVLRPYIYGKPVDLLPNDQKMQTWDDEEANEDIAFYDYILQTVDRRDANMIWEKEIKGKRQLKVIDHTLTFFPTWYDGDFELKGPRLPVAYDNKFDPPRLKKTPLPERLASNIDQFMAKKDEIITALSSLLNQQEIEHLFIRAQKCQKLKTFL